MGTPEQAMLEALEITELDELLGTAIWHVYTRVGHWAILSFRSGPLDQIPDRILEIMHDEIDRDASGNLIFQETDIHPIVIQGGAYVSYHHEHRGFDGVPSLRQDQLETGMPVHLGWNIHQEAWVTSTEVAPGEDFDGLVHRAWGHIYDNDTQFRRALKMKFTRGRSDILDPEMVIVGGQVIEVQGAYLPMWKGRSV